MMLSNEFDALIDELNQVNTGKDTAIKYENVCIKILSTRQKNEKVC